ncbi:MAG: TIGR04086 family membrane protein [Desulfocucumaceae bacterium]
MSFKPSATSRPSINFTAIFRGLAAALGLSLAGSFLLGVVYHYTGLKESTLPLSSSILLFASVFLGGFLSSRHSGSRGLFHGLSVGFLVFILIWLFTGLFLATGLGFIPLLQKFLVCAVGGTLGGIFGVGL